LTSVKRRAIIEQYQHTMVILRNLRFFFKDSVVLFSLVSIFLLTLAQLITLFINIKPKAEPIFLHYTTYFGVDFIGAWYLVYGLPLASLVIGLFNTGLAYLLVRREKVLGYVLLISSVLVSVLLLIVALLVVRLNS